MRIGITGHMDLTSTAAQLVRAELQAELDAHPPGDLIGVSCLAQGADSLFAQAVLDAGGQLEVLLPAPDYRSTQVGSDQLAIFDSLVAQACGVKYIAESSSTGAYVRANAAMIERVDMMIAVWDGKSAFKIGGTADAVAAAQRAGVPVTVVWPDGAQRCS